MREVEDADIDRRDGHARLLASLEAGKLHGDAARSPRGRVFSGAAMLTSSLCAASSIWNHATPMARAGIRFCLTSSGRCVIATA